MNKLKVGDIVKVKVFKERPRHWCIYGRMDKYMGREVTIRYVNMQNSVRIFEDIKDNDGGWYWRQSDFESADFLSNKDLLI